MQYLEQINKGMELLHNEGATFVGQAVKYKGTGITRQIARLDSPSCIELPVAEDFQMGFCIGLALNGYLPVSVYPRFNFALLAANQIVNHLDKFPAMHAGNPQVIIKVVVGSEHPLDPGQQHKADYAAAFKLMCEHINIVDLKYPHQIVPAYERSLSDDRPTMLIEHADLYRCEAEG